MGSRKALHFDLDYNLLKDKFNEKNPQYAYKLIEDFLIENGFEHHQYSGYQSKYCMNTYKAKETIIRLQEKYPWFMECAKSVTVTSISKIYELKDPQIDGTLSKGRKTRKHPSLSSKNREAKRNKKDKGIER